MSVKFAFAGFRHGHIMALYNRVKESKEAQIVAACEEDPTTRAKLAAEGKVKITHEGIDEMLAEVACDVVAVGDYYAKRGSIIIKAMELGKHVIADKPLCTRLEELDRIEALSRSKELKVSCMFDLRDVGQFIGMRRLVQEDALGEIHAAIFFGQHPLNLATRPSWYFEPGKHGGTINDIGIHGVDAVSWITGLRYARINAARTWNAFVHQFPHFHDGAQMMLTMENGCGVLGDVSYFSPDSTGYSLPQSWRMTFWGRKGVIEAGCRSEKIMFASAGKKEVQYLDVPPSTPGGCLRSLLAEMAGRREKDGLDTRQVLASSRVALLIQKAAEEGAREVILPKI